MDLPTTFDTPRLHLRPPVAADAERMFLDLARHPEVSLHLTWPPHDDVSTTLAVIEMMRADREAGTAATWALTPRGGGDLVGLFTCWPTAHGIELGYCLAPHRWGEGLMTEVATAMTEHLLAQDGIFRVWAACDVANVASARVLEKAGFTREGLLRRFSVHPNVGPEPRDCLLYARTVP